MGIGCPGPHRAKKIWGCDGEKCDLKLSAEKRKECRQLHRSQGYKISFTKRAGKRRSNG